MRTQSSYREGFEQQTVRYRLTRTTSRTDVTFPCCTTNMVHKPISMFEVVGVPAANGAIDRDRSELRMKQLNVCCMIIMLTEHYRNSKLHTSCMLLVQQPHHKSHQTHYTRRTFLSREPTQENVEHQRESRLYFVHDWYKDDGFYQSYICTRRIRRPNIEYICKAY